MNIMSPVFRFCWWYNMFLPQKKYGRTCNKNPCTGVYKIRAWCLDTLKWRIIKILWVCLLFSVPLKNISFIWKRQHCQWMDLKNKDLNTVNTALRKGSLSCHTCFETEPRFYVLGKFQRRYSYGKKNIFPQINHFSIDRT